MPEKPAQIKRAREPMKVEGANQTKAHIRSGGIVYGKRDPLRHAPLRQPYAGASPEKQGTPEEVTKAKPRSKTRGQARRA